METFLEQIINQEVEKYYSNLSDRNKGYLTEDVTKPDNLSTTEQRIKHFTEYIHNEYSNEPLTTVIRKAKQEYETTNNFQLNDNDFNAFVQYYTQMGGNPFPNDETQIRYVKL